MAVCVVMTAKMRITESGRESQTCISTTLVALQQHSAQSPPGHLRFSVLAHKLAWAGCSEGVDTHQ